MLHYVLLESDNYYKMFIYAAIVTFLEIHVTKYLTTNVPLTYILRLC